MRIALGSDEKTALTDVLIEELRARGCELLLFGPVAPDDPEVDWPLTSSRVAESVSEGRAEQGIVCCWTGTGASIAANKVRGVRAALCHDAETARGARVYNHANVLALSLRATSPAIAKEILSAWFGTPWSADEWNLRQIERLRALEDKSRDPNRGVRGARLARTLEPEVMDTAQEADDYDAMDHAEVNARFCDDLLATGATFVRVLDAGTGTARIPIELCRRFPRLQVEAIDLAESMRAVARRNVEEAGLTDRIHLARADAKATDFADGAFDAVVSNSLVHHMPDPAVLMGELWRLVRPRGLLFVRDLERPESKARVEELVALHARIPSGLTDAQSAAFIRQRALLEASLCAALTLEEVAAIVARLGMPPHAARRTSDRHWTLAWTK